VRFCVFRIGVVVFLVAFVVKSCTALYEREYLQCLQPLDWCYLVIYISILFSYALGKEMKPFLLEFLYTKNIVETLLVE